MVKLVEVMWLWDRGQPLDSLPPDQLCSRKTGVSGGCLGGVWRVSGGFYILPSM